MYGKGKKALLKTDKFPPKYNRNCYLLWTSDDVLRTETGLVLLVKTSSGGKKVEDGF